MEIKRRDVLKGLGPSLLLLCGWRMPEKVKEEVPQVEEPPPVKLDQQLYATGGIWGAPAWSALSWPDYHSMKAPLYAVKQQPKRREHWKANGKKKRRR